MFHIDNGGELKRLPHLPGQITDVIASPYVDVRKGSLQRVSPDEIVHGAVLVCADEIRRNVPEARLRRWRDIFLSCCFVFELSGPGTDECHHMRSYHLQQTSVADYIIGSMMSVKQLAHAIFIHKQLKEAETGMRLNYMQVATLFRRVNGWTARLTNHRIRAALKVYEKIFAHPSLSRCVDQLSERFGRSSCLSTMTSLERICNATATYPLRKWTMEGIVDAVLTGLITNQDVTPRAIYYYGEASMLDLCTLFRFRREVLDRYLDVDLPELGVHCGDLERFRIVLADHESYRTYVRRGPTQAVAVDTKWKARCKQSSILALDLLEDRRLSES
jgi:hypothetical protein